jgi:hypothetical protein
MWMRNERAIKYDEINDDMIIIYVNYNELGYEQPDKPFETHPTANVESCINRGLE